MAMSTSLVLHKVYLVIDQDGQRTEKEEPGIEVN